MRTSAFPLAVALIFASALLSTAGPKTKPSASAPSKPKPSTVLKVITRDGKTSLSYQLGRLERPAANQCLGLIVFITRPDGPRLDETIAKGPGLRFADVFQDGHPELLRERISDLYEGSPQRRVGYKLTICDPGMSLIHSTKTYDVELSNLALDLDALVRDSIAKTDGGVRTLIDWAWVGAKGRASAALALFSVHDGKVLFKQFLHPIAETAFTFTKPPGISVRKDPRRDLDESSGESNPALAETLVVERSFSYLKGPDEKAVLPPFFKTLDGGHTFRFRNHCGFDLEIGIRSGDGGRDLTVRNGETVSVKIPDGKYRSYIIIGGSPKDLYEAKDLEFSIHGHGLEAVFRKKLEFRDLP